MIRHFRGLYNFLSNFYMSTVVVDGVAYPSVEHAYQAHKSDNQAWKLRCTDRSIIPSAIKKESYAVKLVKDWDVIKMDVMRKCLMAKFSKDPLRSMLLDTGLREIQEGNNWGDLYWGVDLVSGEGQNHLGKLLMEVREKLANQPLPAYKRNY